MIRASSICLPALLLALLGPVPPLHAAAPGGAAHAADTVIDGRLMWKRCSEGQRWEHERCHGPALPHTWDEARAMAEVSRYGGHADWRLPTLDELSALRQQFAASAWPGTPALPYWSGTAVAHGRDGAFVVDFGTGAAAEVSRLGDGHPVRLVRDVE